MSDREWLADAACSGVDPEVFFPSNYTDAEPVAFAVRICDGCAVREECLRDALARPEPSDRDGIFGGRTPRQRRRMRGGKTSPTRRPPVNTVRPDEVRVDVTGTRWRLRALAAHGWPTNLLAVELGTTVQVIQSARHNRSVSCPEGLADWVVREWPRLVANPPVGKAARSARARALWSGWPRPHELDLDRVDDPDYTPIRQET